MLRLEVVMPKHAARILLFATLMTWESVPAAAQQFRATISGKVADPSGSNVPQAEVAAVNTATQVRTATHTDTDGSFVITELPPGIYDLSVSSTGFRGYVRKGITLAVGEKANVEVKLEVGDVSTSVAVTAELTGVEANQDITGQLMDNKQVSELPLNGRQVFMLLQLSSGVVFTQQFFGPGGFSGTRAYDVNGEWTVQGSYVNASSGLGSNGFMLDGVPLGVNGEWDFSPVVDSLQEYKVMMPTNDASLGRRAAASSTCRRGPAATTSTASSAITFATSYSTPKRRSKRPPALPPVT